MDANANNDIDLSDLSFDFEDYFQRHDDGDMSEYEREEFSARIIGLFCREVIARRQPPRWVLSYLVEQFHKILAGEEQAAAFPFPEPWPQPTPIFSRAEEQALSIFCDIVNLLRSDSSLKVTHAIAFIATKRHVSYETARAAYYRHVKHIKS